MHLRQGAGVLLAVFACTPPGKPLSSEPAPTTPLVGDTICLAGVAGLQTLMNPGAMAVEIARFKDLGVKFIRFDLTWSDVETVAGVYNFEWLDAPLQALEAAHTQVIPILDYGNTLYNGRTDGNTSYPTPPAPYAAFAGAVAQRFGTRLGPYEIWNEENVGYRFWLPKEDPVAYAALAEAANASIKQGCPACQVIFGGVYWHAEVLNTSGVDFIQAACAADPALAASLNGFGVHPYALYPPMAPPDAWQAPEAPLTDMVTQAVAASGLTPPPPAWITEVGWPIQQGSVDEPTQASDLVKAYALANRVSARSVCWYNLQDGPNPTAFPPEDAFGLLNYDAAGPATATPKLSYGALKNVSQRLGPTGFSRDRGAELGLTRPGAAALLFRDSAAKRGVTVYWSAGVERGATVHVQLHGPVTARLIDVMGNSSLLSPAKDNTVDVPLDDTARLLVEDAAPVL
jgi:hypothetical protein